MGIPFESEKRFRINPIEVAIFTVISLIFIKSSYSLLYAHEGFEPVALTASAEDPIAFTGSRLPAASSAPKIFTEVRIGCDPAKDEQTVSAKKIRLIGSFCQASGAVPAEAPDSVKEISVVNTSAKIVATVFPDYTNQKFSTDYITLAQGKNVIHVEYEFKNGTNLGREYSITKE